MGFNKNELDKLILFVKVLKNRPGNEDFINKLREVLEIKTPLVTVSNSTPIPQIDEIYEYCIEEVIQKQANEFYADFPIPEIVPTLVKDFIRMERFRREDNFGDFCLAAYQQIEAIANCLCKNPKLNTITEQMWGCSAYIKESEDRHKPATSQPNNSDYTIAKLVFPGENKKTNFPFAVEKSKQSIQTLYAKDKIRTVVYFVCYKAMMGYDDYKNYVNITSLLTEELYMCRNMNHRGNTLTDYEQNAINKIIPQRSLYYLKFMGALSNFVAKITEGFPYLDKIEAYAKSIQKQIPKAIDLKIIGSIDPKLLDDGKKRFRK